MYINFAERIRTYIIIHHSSGNRSYRRGTCIFNVKHLWEQITDRKEYKTIYTNGPSNKCGHSIIWSHLLAALMRSATKITHKAQAVTCLATKWHVCATVDSAEIETPVARRTSGNHIFPIAEGSSDNDVGDEEDELDNSNIIPSYAYSTISFQKRQALATYFANNKAGVTLYGFMLDRGSLHTIFVIQLSLVLWLLGKTMDI
ncbi:guanyl-nucleotide exchange factor [Lithospermum erythrorhizon]|uniref:Guanyl-nucleotide exchange factor n=1 Tax=Lithospermum erythrorhizon TaxID=34254 RepID=A0AAV3PI52_LITER